VPLRWEQTINLDYATLDALRRQHPAWRLLLADHAPLIASFLQRVFVDPNVRVLAQSALAEALEDTLFGLREQLGASAFPKSATDYLNDWAAPERGWLRKFYPPGSDEVHFDLTPATERAFVGTESRLLTLFDLLQQMRQGSQTDPQAREAELLKRRAAIDDEIARVRTGDLPLLDDTALRERFMHFSALARELLTDFREVEHNFRTLDRSVRERIALWQGAKGTLLQTILGERDAIAQSDQGKSFRAFWDFLMSQQRQDEWTDLLGAVMTLPPVAALHPDPRLKRVHYDWLDAGAHAQATVALLSQQLRRFLDDQAWLENRRIMDVVRSIEARALAVRADPPGGEFMAIDDLAPSINLPMERPLYSPPAKLVLDKLNLLAGEGDLDPHALFDQVRVDKALLAGQVRQMLQQRAQVTLSEVLAEHPLQQGLGELVAYLQLASESAHAVVDDSVLDTVQWHNAQTTRQARLPRVIFVRS